MKQHLLADQLGDHFAFLLVGDLLGRIVQRPLRQVHHDLVEQFLPVITARGRKHDPLPRRRRLLPWLCRRQRPIRFDVAFHLIGRQEMIHLVEGQNDRAVTHFAQGPSNAPIVLVGPFRQIDHEHDHIPFADRVRGCRDHVFPQ